MNVVLPGSGDWSQHFWELILEHDDGDLPFGRLARRGFHFGNGAVLSKAGRDQKESDDERSEVAHG
jgi:hypothetical protein